MSPPPRRWRCRAADAAAAVANRRVPHPSPARQRRQVAGRGGNRAARRPRPRRRSAKKPTPARETRLKLDLTNDSWVEVYDSRGERLFYDVASAGSVQSVAGRGPLRVVLGNAAGVTVEVDGQSREIPANAADGEGARFVVNRSGSLSRGR